MDFSLLDVFRYLLEVVYLILAIIASVGFVKLQLRGVSNTLSKAKYLFLLILMSCGTRFCLDIVPDSYWDSHVNTIPILQMVLDILPELLFFSCYFMLLVMWIELYYTSYIRDEPEVFRRMWILFSVVAGSIFFTGIIFAIAVGASGPYSNLHVVEEVIFLTAVSLLFTISFPVGSFVLYKKVKDSQSVTSKKKTHMLQRLQRLLVLCIICSILHMAYTLVLVIFLQGVIDIVIVNDVIWLCYFLFTEQLPTGFILFLLFRLAITTVSVHKTHVKVGGNVLTPLLAADVSINTSDRDTDNV